MTLAELAERLQVSHQQLQKYETGTNRISASMAVDIINVLKIDIRDLFMDIQRRAKSKSNADERVRQECHMWIDHANSPEKLKMIARVLRALIDKS